MIGLDFAALTSLFYGFSPLFAKQGMTRVNAITTNFLVLPLNFLVVLLINAGTGNLGFVSNVGVYYFLIFAASGIIALRTWENLLLHRH